MSNLLDRSSLVLTPTAYNNGEALCVKPDDGSGDFDFSRNSAATRVNAQGLVENVQILSSNLVQNGDFSELGAEEVSNGSFSQQGSELIVNGDFSNGSTDWYLIGDVSISNGVATFLDSGSNTNSRLIQTSISIGNSYKVTFEVTRYVNGRVQVFLGSGTTISVDISSGVGTYTIYGVSSGSSQFELKRNGGYPNFDFDIDNVSVVEVGQNWNLGNKWSIGENSAIRVPNSTSNLSQVISGISGKTIKVSYEVSNYVGGDIGASADGNNYNANNGNGTFVEYITPTSDNFYLRASYSFEGSVTNISVKEVGQNWDFGAGWEIADSEATKSGTDLSYLTQSSLTSVIGKTYNVKASITNVTTGNVRIDNFTSGTVYTSDTEINVIYTATTAGAFRFLGWAGFDGSVTNISVVEITDDTNLPRINYEGFSYQDVLGSEEVVNGTFDTNLNNWIAYSNTLISWESGGYALLNSNNNYWCKIQQGNVFEVGKTYKVTLTAKSNRTDLSFHNSPIVGSFSQADTFETFEQYYTATTTQFLFGYANAGSATITIDNVSVKEYFGQEVVPDSGCGSWLFEPQSTNLMTTSEPTGTGGFKTGVVFQQTGIFDWNGIYYGDNSVRRVAFFTPITITPNVDFCISLFVKMTDGSVPNYSNSFQSSETDFTFNFSGTPQVGTPILISNGIYRINIVGQSSVNSFNILVEKTTSMSSKSFEISGFQLEQQSYATSYIPTSGTSVTRNQDVCNNGGSLASINSTEGVLYAEILKKQDDNDNFIIISLNNNASNNDANYVSVGFNNSNKFWFGVKSPNGSHINQTIVANENQFYKVALKYKSGDIAIWVNGVEAATSAISFSFTQTLDNLSFDYDSNGGFPFYGKTKALAVFPYLSDEELTELTQV